jgi:peptidoglycan-associated lipoprotein
LKTAEPPLKTAEPPPTAVASIKASASPSSAPGSSARAAVSATAEPPAPAASVAAATASASPSQGATTQGATTPSTTGQPIQDVIFSLDSYRIANPTSIAELTRAAQELAKNPAKRLVVRGHSDQMGLPEHKRAISERRATTVKNFLVSHGAPSDRVTIEAVGDSEPADPGNNPTAWAKNRRVQVLWR